MIRLENNQLIIEFPKVLTEKEPEEYQLFLINSLQSMLTEEPTIYVPYKERYECYLLLELHKQIIKKNYPIVLEVNFLEEEMQYMFASALQQTFLNLPH